MKRDAPITTYRQVLAVAKLSAPFHPISVHFTVALLVTSVICDGVSFVFGLPSLTEAGWWTLVGCCLSTPLTLLTGLISRMHLPMQESVARSFLRAHMAVGPLVFGLLLVMTLWRAALWEEGHTVTVLYLAAAIGVSIVMTLQGYLGGELAYRYGADVKEAYREMPGHSPKDRQPVLVGHPPARSERSAERPTS